MEISEIVMEITKEVSKITADAIANCAEKSAEGSEMLTGKEALLAFAEVVRKNFT